MYTDVHYFYVLGAMYKKNVGKTPSFTPNYTPHQPSIIHT